MQKLLPSCKGKSIFHLLSQRNLAAYCAKLGSTFPGRSGTTKFQCLAVCEWLLGFSRHSSFGATL